jgi:hypothetical protein
MKPDAQIVREIQMLFRDADGDGIRRQHATELQTIFAAEGVKVGIRKMRRLAASAAVLMRRKGAPFAWRRRGLFPRGARDDYPIMGGVQRATLSHR